MQFRHFLDELCWQEVDKVLVGMTTARSLRDQRRRRIVLQRLDVAEFHAFQVFRASQVDRVIKLTDVFNDRIVVQLFYMIQRDYIEVETKMSTWTPSNHACRAQTWSTQASSSCAQVHLNSIPWLVPNWAACIQSEAKSVSLNGQRSVVGDGPTRLTSCTTATMLCDTTK